MKLTNTQLINYKDRIKFSIEDKKRHQDQIDNLIRCIQTKISENTDIKILKILQSGSWRKNTIIKPKGDIPVDIDLIFFFDIEVSDYSELYNLKTLILPLLQSIYPQKNDSDFWESSKTIGLEFIESGLNIDIVPVGKTHDADYVFQPEKNYNIYYTSPQKQLDFISARKNDNLNYTTIVRILKKWRNNQNVELSSFAIELIVAHLDINEGIITDIQEAILRFFRLVSKKQFPVLLFNAEYGTYKHDGSHVYIADPTHEENNIVKNVSNTEWSLARIKASSAFETLLLAEEEEYLMPTVELWKEVFGSDFNIDIIQN